MKVKEFVDELELVVSRCMKNQEKFFMDLSELADQWDVWLRKQEDNEDKEYKVLELVAESKSTNILDSIGSSIFALPAAVMANSMLHTIKQESVRASLVHAKQILEVDPEILKIKKKQLLDLIFVLKEEILDNKELQASDQLIEEAFSMVQETLNPTLRWFLDNVLIVPFEHFAMTVEDFEFKQMFKNYVELITLLHGVASRKL